MKQVMKILYMTKIREDSKSESDPTDTFSHT